MRQTVRLLLAAAIVAVAAGAAVAQTNMAQVNIDFSFVAAGQTMPAGKYVIEISPGPGGRVTMRGAKTAVLLVVTRLGRHDNDKDPELVFDKVDGKFLLSEVWLAGEDGYLLTDTKAEHGHFVVGGSHPSK
jgi:hypothetical protein